MSQRRNGSHFSGTIGSEVTTNKGTVNFRVNFLTLQQFSINFFCVSIEKASTRCHQQQVRTRPVSNFPAAPLPETQRKYVNFLNSIDASAVTQQKTQKMSGNVKLDVNRLLSPDVARIINNRRAAKNLPMECNQRTRVRTFDRSDDDSDSDAETYVDSLYDNENFGRHDSETMGESEFEVETEPEPDVSKSIQNLQNELDRITYNYVHKVKTEIEEAMSNMKILDRPKLVKRVQEKQERGAGDKKRAQDEKLFVLKKAEIEKNECYRKIGAILHRMRDIDNMTEEFMKNHITYVMNKQ